MSKAPIDASAGYPHSDLVLDRLPLGVVFQDAQGEIRVANPAAERILGLSLDQMRGVRSIDPRWRAMHEDGSPFPGEQHPAMITLRTGEPVRDVVMGVFNPQNEAYTWIKVSTWPVRNPAGGALEGVYAFFEDITAQKTAQQQEAASEAHFDTVFAAMSEGLALHRMVYDNTDHPVDYRILDVNPAFTTQTGFTREAVVGRLGSEAYGTGSAPFLERYAQVARTGQAQVFEHYFEPLGRYFHISVFCPEPGHFGTVFEDITERKRTEATLQRQRTMLARTERIAHVGSWEWEIATDTVTWSEELFRIFQRDPEEGAPSYAEHPQLYVPEDMQRLHAMVAEALEHGTAYTLELRAIRRDGAIRICKAHGEVQRDTDGRITHLIGAFQDITEQKQAEAELERYRQELESLVEQRTAALQQTNDQLVHTQFAMDRAGIGIAWNNPETGQFFYANDELCRQLGYTRDELMSLTSATSIPPFRPRLCDSSPTLCGREIVSCASRAGIGARTSRPFQSRSTSICTMSATRNGSSPSPKTSPHARPPRPS
jgi:PAS domain S-box-containing protein